ncbi:MAG: hypothetical protein WC303_03270 [Candidatus Paceibacterota bacterium]|jgi:hypothetical protein
MNSLSIKYFSWQFIEKPKQIILIIKNYLMFGNHFFSIKNLLLSLFDPWKKITEDYGQGFNPSTYFNAFAGNLISRAIGFVVRLLFIAGFLIFETIILILGILFLLIWFLLPLIIIAGLIYGFRLLF